MAISYTALATEINNDPTSLGYAPHRTSGNDGAIADLLNAVSPSILIDRDVIDSHEVIDATVPSEWAALTAAEKQRYQTLTGAGKVNPKSANTRQTFGQMFGVGTTTRTNLTSLQTRPGSRAEQLFGSGTFIYASDVAKALR